MKRTLSILVFLTAQIAAAQTAPTADSLGIQDLVRRAVDENPAVLESKSMESAAEAAARASRSGLYPNARGDASYIRLGPVPVLTFPGLGDFRLFPANNYDAHIGVSQVVYDFNRVSTGADLAEAKAQLSGDHTALLKRELAFRTMQSFYSVLALEQSLVVQDETIRTLDLHLETARKKVESGTATDFDVLTTQVRLTTAKNQRIDLANALAKEQINLRTLAGLPGDAPLALKGSFNVAVHGRNADSLTSLALEQRIEMTSINRVVDNAKLQYKLSGLGDMPSLNVMASWGIKNGYIPSLDILRGNYVAGVELSVPIFNGFRTRYQEEEASAGIEAAQSRRTNTEESIRAEVRQALADYDASVEKEAAAKITIEQAKRAVEIARTRYEAGTVTNLDLLDAETSFAEAELVELQAQFKVALSSVALDRAVGNPLWENAGGTAR